MPDAKVLENMIQEALDDSTPEEQEQITGLWTPPAAEEEPPVENDATEPEPDDAPTVILDGQSLWKDYTDADKAVLMQTLIVRCATGLAANNPTMFIWAPEGTQDEISDMWVSKMTEQLASIGVTPEKEGYTSYFPQIREDKNVPKPQLFTYADRRSSDLRKYFYETCAYAGYKPEDIIATVGATEETFKAFWLLTTVGFAGFQRRLADGAKEAMLAAQGVKQTESGLIVQSGGPIRPR